MPSPLLHIEPMTREEVEAAVGALGVYAESFPRPVVAEPLEKLRRALDAQPEQEEACGSDHSGPCGPDVAECGWCENEGATRDEDGKLAEDCPRCEGRSVLAAREKLYRALDAQPEQQRAEKPNGWSLIHKAHGNREVVEVCVKSDPFYHRFGQVVQITDDGFTLAWAGFRNWVAWSNLRDAWPKGDAPNLCPHCMDGGGDASATDCLRESGTDSTHVTGGGVDDGSAPTQLEKPREGEGDWPEVWLAHPRAMPDTVWVVLRHLEQITQAETDGYEFRRYTPANTSPASTRSVLERLAGELEERAAFHDQQQYRESRDGSRAFQQGAKHGFKKAAQRLREEAEGLPTSDIESRSDEPDSPVDRHPRSVRSSGDRRSGGGDPGIPRPDDGPASPDAEFPEGRAGRSAPPDSSLAGPLTAPALPPDPQEGEGR